MYGKKFRIHKLILIPIESLGVNIAKKNRFLFMRFKGENINIPQRSEKSMLFRVKVVLNKGIINHNVIMLVILGMTFLKQLPFFLIEEQIK